MRKLSRWILFLIVLLSGLVFSAALTDGAAPALTVNGQTENIILSFNEAPSIRAAVPEGATGLILEAERISGLNGEPVDPDDPKEWSEWYDRYRLFPLIEETGKRFSDQGVWRITARYTSDDYEDGADPGQGLVWTNLASLDVIVSNYQARMSAPDITLSPASAAQGSFISVTLNSFQQKNEWYWYELAKMEDSGDWGDWFSHIDLTLKEGVSSAFSVPTLELDPGVYRLSLRTEAVGYEDNVSYKTFTVTENSAPADGIVLRAASVPVNVPVEMNLRAAGADQIEATVTLDEDPYWRSDPFLLDDDTGVWRQYFDRPGTYRVTLTAYENGDGRTAGTAVLTVTASDYLANPVYSGFPGILTAGQDLNGSLVLDARTERAYIELSYCPDNADWQTMYRAGRQIVTPAAEPISFPASLFTRDGRYRLHVYTYAAGIESSYNEYWLLRSSAAAGSATLKVNGGTAAVTVPSSTDVHVELIAPGATAARVLVGDRWNYLGDPGQFAFDLSFGGGDYALTAQITADDPAWQEEGFDWNDFRWEDLHWGPCSNAVLIHAVTAGGRLDQPAVTLETNTVARGEWLRASVAGQNRGEWYWAQVRRLWRNEYGDIQWEHAMDCYGDASIGLAVPTAPLEPGDYFLTIGADAVGWEGAERSVPFTVTGSSASLPQVALYFAQSTILTSQDIAFCAYADGADFVSVDVAWDEDDNWNNHYEDDDGVNTWSFSCSQSGTYVFTLRAWRNGQSMGEDSFTLTVGAPHGQLEDVALQGVPVVTALNTAITGSFTPDANATDYGVSLTYCPNDGPWDTLYDQGRRKGQTDAAALSFPAAYFSRPGIYRLEIHTTAQGYNGAHLSTQILVTESGMQQSLALQVKAGEIYLHQNIPVTVTAPANVTAVRLWSSSYDWWDYRVNDGEGFEWFWGFHNGGDETLFAQGTTDASVLEWLNGHDHDMQGFDWSRVAWTLSSEPVTVSVIKYGDLAAPQVSFPQGTTVERGQMLPLTISPVANAYSYGVQIRRANEDGGNWLMDYDYSAIQETSRISVPTDSLEAGDYVLHIDPRCYGWHGDSKGYPFTVTQSAAWTEEPVFRVSATTLLTREYAIYSIYAPGAEEVMWQIGDSSNRRSQWGDSLTDNVIFYGEADYVMQGFARYPGDDEWTPIGETTVVVTAPYGVMDVSLQAPASIPVSDTLSFSAVCDFKGKSGTVNLYFASPDGAQMLRLDPVEQRDEGGLHYLTYQVEANTLALGPYFITAYVIPGAKGYDVGVDEITIDVTGGTLNAALTVNPNPAEIFDDVHISLQVPQATAVALFSDLNGMNWQYESGDTLDRDEPVWWDGTYVFYGLYTTEEIDPDDEGFSWESVHWEGASNSVSLVVNPPSAELEEINATLNKNTVRRGEKIKVTIQNQNPGLDVSYGANLQPVNHEGYSSELAWFGPEESGGKIIWVETLEAAPGDYKLMISANARGCHPVNTWIPVTITEADQGLQMTVQDQNVLTGNMLQVVGYAKGAAHIRLDVSFENSTWEPDPAFMEAEGDCLNTEVFFGEHPDTVVLDLTAAYPNGSTETLRKTIAVSAPKGPVHPAIQLNSAWQPGRDLYFTVTVEEDVQYVVFVQETGSDDDAPFAQFIPMGHPTKQFHLSADDYTFESGKMYEIRVVAAGTGYDGRQTVLPITRSASLTSLSLPANLKTIEEEAFSGVEAQRIVVPAGVTRIESNAFSACPNLIELVLPDGITSFAADALGSSGPVYVYGQAGGYLEAYAAAVENLYLIPVDSN